jgi:hypothetical protein
VGEALGYFGGRHGGPFGKISRAPGHLAVQQAGRLRGKVVVHAGVHHVEADAVLAAEHVDGGPAAQEVEHHLPGHFRRVGAYARPGHAVVAGKHDHVRLAKHRRKGILNESNLQGQRFQPAQGTQGFGLVVNGSPQLRFEGSRRRVQVKWLHQSGCKRQRNVSG